MAVNVDRARFPCLAIARYMVATVVTVIAVVVIVMVITVDVLGPEQIIVSIKYGHVQVTDLWQKHVTGHGHPTYNYEAAKYVAFGLTLVAENPSGRANIHCKNVTVRFLDMPNWSDYSFERMQELGEIRMPDLSFLVEKKSSHWLTRWNSIENKTMLSYLANTYQGRTSFKGAVNVNVSISSDTPFGQTKFRYVHYYCWPLLVSVDEPSHTERDLTCDQGFDWSLF